jgi:hypothetical protein
MDIFRVCKEFIVCLSNLSFFIMVQIGDSTLNLILDILCKIYRGEVWMYNDYYSSGSFIIFLII